MLKAVAHHTDERWVLLYIERWLKAPMQMPDGSLVAREKGTPPGVSGLADLGQLVHALRVRPWMDRQLPGCPFERYANDIVADCDSEEQARALRAAIANRLGALGPRAASRQDDDRVLQGHESPGDLGAHQLRFLGLHVSGPSRSEPA